MIFIGLFIFLIILSLVLSLFLKKIGHLPWCICFLFNFSISVLLTVPTFIFLVNHVPTFYDAIDDSIVIYTIVGMELINAIISLLLFIIFIFFEAEYY